MFPRVTDSIAARGWNVFQWLISRSRHRGWVTTLNGAVVSTELIIIKGDVRDPLRMYLPWVFWLHLSVLLPCEWWGRRYSQLLQHRGCADQATVWGYSPKYKQASNASFMMKGGMVVNHISPGKWPVCCFFLKGGRCHCTLVYMLLYGLYRLQVNWMHWSDFTK